MTFDDLDRGDKRDFHVKLYERELAVLDDICARYRISRAIAIGRMIEDFAARNSDMAGVPAATKPGAFARRR